MLLMPSKCLNWINKHPSPAKTLWLLIRDAFGWTFFFPLGWREELFKKKWEERTEARTTKFIWQMLTFLPTRLHTFHRSTRRISDCIDCMRPAFHLSREARSQKRCNLCEKISAYWNHFQQEEKSEVCLKVRQRISVRQRNNPRRQQVPSQPHSKEKNFTAHAFRLIVSFVRIHDKRFCLRSMQTIA